MSLEAQRGVFNTRDLSSHIFLCLPDHGGAYARVSRSFQRGVEEARNIFLTSLQAHPYIQSLVAFSSVVEQQNISTATKLQAIMRQLKIASEVHPYLEDLFRETGGPSTIQCPKAEDFPLPRLYEQADRYIELANKANYNDYFISALILGDLEQAKKYPLDFIKDRVKEEALEICLEHDWLDFCKFLATHINDEQIDLSSTIQSARTKKDFALLTQIRRLPLSFNRNTEILNQAVGTEEFQRKYRSTNYRFDADNVLVNVCKAGDDQAIQTLLYARHYVHNFDGTYYLELEQNPHAHQYEGLHYALLEAARNRNVDAFSSFVIALKRREENELHPIDPRIIQHVSRYLASIDDDSLEYLEKSSTLTQCYFELISGSESEVSSEESSEAEQEVAPSSPKRARLIQGG